MSNLTPKQEKFCLVYMETGNASEAYRQAYDVREGTKESTINRKAKTLVDQSNISARISELRATHAARHNVTVDSLIADLEADRQLAREIGQPGAAISASMGKAKLLGLDKQVIDHVSSDKSMAPLMVKLVAVDASG